MKVAYSRAKYKEKRRIINYVIRHLKGPEVNVKLLDEYTEVIIDKFIKNKVRGIPIIYKLNVVSDTTWKPTNALSNKYRLENFFKLFIRKRQELNPSNQEPFSLKSFSLKDYLSYEEVYGSDKKLVGILKQVFMFILETEILTDDQRENLEYLYLKIPKPNPKTFPKRKKNTGQNYLSRKDFLMMIKTAFSTCRNKTTYKFVIFLGTLCFLALRVGEGVQIQVQDFELDENYLLKDVGNGFGMLHLPAYKSKGGYSPSIQPYHIAVVPILRELINTYLQTNFFSGYSLSTYLFRCKPINEHDEAYDEVPNPSKELEYAIWLKRTTNYGQAMVDEIYMRGRHLFETKIRGRVSSHDLRRSCNDWIKKTPSLLPADSVRRIAEIHLRHTSKGNVNEKHYTSDPTIKEYIFCINEALNFPWNLSSIKEWENSRKIFQSNNDNSSSYPLLDATYERADTCNPISLIRPKLLSPKQMEIQRIEEEIKKTEKLLSIGDQNAIVLEARISELFYNLNKVREED